MNSNMLAGERRWASSRRGGMTVLGKVAVPKPINLPSQRLENHGLDRNVEIVPKGTVSWGSRPSSSGSSPWNSSSLSPNADGGTVSPSHPSGRPSSGGSGTRPSTSGSDRTHDQVPNAWSANSRPSSASGTLSTNQTSSSSLRPRSAENRPNSSQLSRFAEPVSKSHVAWDSSVTAERLGVKSMKEDNFSLTSGDFPTLGSEKDNSLKKVEPEVHFTDSRPSSASGRIVQANKEDNIPHAGVLSNLSQAEWGAEEDAKEAVSAKRMAPSQNPSNSHGNRIHSADMKVKAFDGMPNSKGLDDNRTNQSEAPPSFPSVVPQFPVSSERDAAPATTKKAALIHKIDGLNAKFRVTDGWNDSTNADDREKDNNCTRDVGTAAMASHRTPVSRNYVAAPDAVTVPVGDNPLHPIAVIPRRSYHGGHSRVDHRGKGKFNSQEADGWRRKPLSNDSSSAVIASNNESTPNIQSCGPNNVGESSENSMVDPVGKVEEDLAEVCDSTDIQAQRAKMKELAKQRYLQLQKEEEERVREQKAKALAKLEELDRRKQAGANQKAERTPVIGDVRVEQQEVHTVIGTVIAELKTNESGFNLVLSPAVAAVGTDSNTNQAGESVEVSRDLRLTIQHKGLVESNVSPLPRIEDFVDGNTKGVVSPPDDGGISRHKRAGYKQKQNNMPQKHPNEKPVSSSTFEVQKDRTLAAVADMHEPPSSESNVVNTSKSVVEPLAQQRKRISRSNKPKPKPEETPIVSVLPSVTSNVTPENESIDNVGSNDSVSNMSASVSTTCEPDTAVHSRELSSSLPSEESQSKVPTQWKPNRRIPKNQQGHRFTDKHHGSSDTVVWAPKAKASDEVSQSSLQESANLMKNENVAQNSLKGKRAEMERYVPKPQLAQQGSSPPFSSSVSSSRLSEGAAAEQSGSAISANSQPVISATANAWSNLEMNVGDSNHSKNKKDHGTWKQRGVTESSQMKSVPTGPTDTSQVKGVHTGSSPISEPTKEIQLSKELVHSGRSESNRANAEFKISGAAMSKHPSVKDQGATGRGKRHPPRGPRSGGNNSDFENTLHGEGDGSLSSAPDVNQMMDKSNISKENRSFGERTSSHWQPKSSPNSANNQQGNRNAGSESITLEANRAPRKSTQRKMQSVPQQDKESSNFSQPQLQPGQSENVKSNVSDDSVARLHQDYDEEKKPAPVKGRPYSPNQDPVGTGESSLTNTVDLLEHNVTSGSRRAGRQNNRPVRGHDTRAELSSGHENRPHNAPAFRDRQRQNVHLEYQPVGPFKGHKPEKVEELADGGADSMDQRYRERGQSNFKRGGNYYRR
ncbi:LOW QUALITY PROTEIN: protein MODIFIER OF SNC1 1-like [Salvia hispanica]|uniref:LOW QUALITY PROTEIN: protein MODIFIER OF SNC1 1-like n=1 Tax=Salvia hispanica TaxID=49212 RepID=UPI002009C888|nr:LOW QUALITY PROTEIN: protein MODIFIER OF SNC1 1-like [Salvia hispanica]